MVDPISTLEQAITEAQAAVEGHGDAEAESLVLRDLALRARKLRRAWARKQSVGLFGPSQAGKSFLVGALLSHELGSLKVLSGPSDEPKGIILGRELSRQIGALAGDIVAVVSPIGKLTPLGRVANEARFQVKAIFESGMYDYDSSLVYLSLPDAQEFLSFGDEVTGIELRVADIDESDTIAGAVQEKLGCSQVVF